MKKIPITLATYDRIAVQRAAKPWLGRDAVISALPFPKLIDVRLAPGATPGPTAVPAVPTSGDGSSTVPLILGVVLLIVLVGGGSFFMGRRRQSGAQPPEA